MSIDKRRHNAGIAVVLILILLGIVAFVLLKVFTPKHVPFDDEMNRTTDLSN